MNIRTVFAACSAAIPAVLLAASPAVTYDQMTNYVATVLKDYRPSGGTAPTSSDFSTNTVSGIMNNIRLQMALSRLGTNTVSEAGK